SGEAPSAIRTPSCFHAEDRARRIDVADDLPNRRDERARIAKSANDTFGIGPVSRLGARVDVRRNAGAGSVFDDVVDDADDLKDAEVVIEREVTAKDAPTGSSGERAIDDGFLRNRRTALESSRPRT